ncbi:hypothetical protein G2W53_004534 [Senna tora]|uniref:Reverse transcriptase zinc-binding domain-containing protein n=1 Tax=Senna tora TaxID=362788 RepID=A0A835CI58_9FABA|nr:hypothetical protein G2W53_004534 [Senna tora]
MAGDVKRIERERQDKSYEESLFSIQASQNYISGKRVDAVLKRMEFKNSVRVEAEGFSGDICPQASLGNQLWEDLRTIANGTTEAWILLGDFNAYLSPNDEQGRLKFTWERQEVKERLDWVFTNQEGALSSRMTNVTHLPKQKSDHSPILLSLPINDRSEVGSRPFCFQEAWLSDNSFHTSMENAWCTTGDWSTNTNTFTSAVKARNNCSNLWNDKQFSGLGKMTDHVHNAPPEIDQALIPPHPSRQDCKKVWRCLVPERVCTFIWLMAHGKVLTNSHRMHRNMTMDATCPRCGRENEIVIHDLRDYHVSNGDDLFFAAWYSISDIIAAAENNTKPMASPKVIRMIRWISPERDRFKCNTDGLVLEGVNIEACGGVICDSSGLFLMGFSQNLDSRCATMTGTCVSVMCTVKPIGLPTAWLVWVIRCSRMGKCSLDLLTVKLVDLAEDVKGFKKPREVAA